MKDFIKGFGYAMAGFSWVLRPKIRRFVYVPLLINLILFTLAIFLLSHYAEGWVTGWIGEKADWWIIFQWAYVIISPLLTFLVYMALFLVIYFSFSVLANLIAAPFNALLSKSVEQRLAGQTLAYPEQPFFKEVITSFKTEFVKLIRFIVFSCIILLILFIPVVNVVFPFVWFIFMAYTLSLQYADYPMSNNGLTYAMQRKILLKNRWQRIGFGTAANIMLFIPVVNFTAMPVCVCGATAWWHKELSKQSIE